MNSVFLSEYLIESLQSLLHEKSSSKAQNENLLSKTDRRQVITDEKCKLPPFKAVGKLLTKNNNKKGQGTGTLIANNIVLTCAHNLHIDDKQVPGCEFCLPFYSNDDLMKTLKSSDIRIPEEFRQFQKEDYALVLLDLSSNQSRRIQQDFPYFSDIMCFSEDLRKKIKGVLIAGFGERNGHSNRLLAMGCSESQLVFPNSTIEYEIDTTEGQSGSPILLENQDIIGIHTLGSQKRNIGVLMTYERREMINKWKREWQKKAISHSANGLRATPEINDKPKDRIIPAPPVNLTSVDFLRNCTSSMTQIAKRLQCFSSLRNLPEFPFPTNGRYVLNSKTNLDNPLKMCANLFNIPEQQLLLLTERANRANQEDKILSQKPGQYSQTLSQGYECNHEYKDKSGLAFSDSEDPLDSGVYELLTNLAKRRGKDEFEFDDQGDREDEDNNKKSKKVKKKLYTFFDGSEND